MIMMEGDKKTPMADEKLCQDENEATHKYRVYKSVCIYSLTLLYGVVLSTIGPTLPNLEMLLDTDLHHLSMALMAKGIGYLVGSLLVGLVMDLLNHELFFFLSTVTQGVVVALAPCTGSIYGFMACLFLLGLAGGVRAAGGQAYIIKLWEGSRWKRPTTQAFDTHFSIGAMFGPLLARPFLVRVPTDGVDSPAEITNFNMTTDHATEVDLFNNNISILNSSVLKEEADFSSVMYPYIITGVTTVASSLLFLAVLIKEGKPLLSPRPATQQNNNEGSSSPQIVAIIPPFKLIGATILALFATCQFCFAFQEHVPGNFLATFVIRGLGWDVIGGSTITAVYYGCFLAGRLFGVAASIVLSPTAMLLLNFPLTAIGFTLMCFVPYLPEVFTNISVGMAAFGMSSSTPTLFLWCSRYIPITGKVAAIVTAGNSLGEFAGQPLTAHLIHTFSPMYVAYVPLAASILELSLFGALNAIARCCPRPISERVMYISVEEKEQPDTRPRGDSEKAC